MHPLLPILAVLGCGSQTEDTAVEAIPPLSPDIVAKMSPENMQAHVDVLADDTLGGRAPGSHGSSVARDYILAEMQELGLEPIGLNGQYEFPYDNSPDPSRYMLTEAGEVVPHATLQGITLAGLLPGSDPELADEYMVVMAHYDHLGVDEDGNVFNGAFDNAAAVGMNLEMARVFIENDAIPKRSTLFLFTDDEEYGLDGAEMWIEAPTVPKEDIVFGVSTDPLGRRLVPDFGPIALMGTERASGLAAAWQHAAQFVDAPVYFIDREVIPIFASDQDPFFDRETPALWFTNLGFSFYHTTGDTAETVDYRMMLENAALLAQLLHHVGNGEERFDYTGTPEPGSFTASEAKRLLEDLKQSSYLDQSDRDLADYYIGQLEQVIEADSHEVLPNSEALYTAALYFLLFDLPGKFPGEVPPPWPE